MNIFNMNFQSSDNCVDYFKCKENGKLYARQYESAEHTSVGWYIAPKRKGNVHFEADVPLNEGTVINVLDSNGSILFTETIKAVGNGSDKKIYANKSMIFRGRLFKAFVRKSLLHTI